MCNRIWLLGMVWFFAYAYRSTGRDAVMSEDRVEVLELALKYLVIVMKDRGVDLNQVNGAVAERLLQSSERKHLAAQAVIAIEAAADAAVG